MEVILNDLAIVGGGPAGASAALEGRRLGLEVSLFEAGCFPRDKVCGEFLSAESLPLLERLVPELLARGAPIRECEFISQSGTRRGFSLSRPGLGLSRRLLDEALWRAAAASGAHVFERTPVRRLRSCRDGMSTRWELESAAENRAKARGLILACGRWWELDGIDSPARSTKANRVGPWLGAKAHFRGVEAKDAVEMFYFPGGYCGLAPVEDGLYNACCLVHRRLARRSGLGPIGDFKSWLRVVTRHPALESRLRNAIQASETVSTAPVQPARRQAECSGALLVGDASGFLDPFTGDGISMALQSGKLAAEVLARALASTSNGMEQTALIYRRRLDSAVRRSYWVARLLRSLVLAPAEIQSFAASALIRLGRRLMVETRWRASGEPGLQSF